MAASKASREIIVKLVYSENSPYATDYYFDRLNTISGPDFGCFLYTVRNQDQMLNVLRRHSPTVILMEYEEATRAFATLGRYAEERKDRVELFVGLSPISSPEDWAGAWKWLTTNLLGYQTVLHSAKDRGILQLVLQGVAAWTAAVMLTATSNLYKIGGENDEELVEKIMNPPKASIFPATSDSKRVAVADVSVLDLAAGLRERLGAEVSALSRPSAKTTG